MSRSAKHGTHTVLRRMRMGRRTGLSRSRGGLAAIEFALIAPVMVSACAGMYDLTMGFLAWQRVNMSALSIDQMVTYEAAANPNTNTNILAMSNLRAPTSAIYAYLPDTLSAPLTSYGVVVTSVVVTQPQGSSNYIWNVAWSGQFQGAAGTLRACGTNPQTSWVADTASPSPATLPVDLQQPQPVMVVDIYYTYTPLFFTFITGNIVMMQSAYFPPRTGLANAWVGYFPVGSGDPATLCAGYPASTVSP